MKRRDGFVSNSSSSSFIVAFSKMPTSAKELQEQLFKDSAYVCAYSDPLPTNHAAQLIFEDIKAQPSKTIAEVQEELSYGWPEHPFYPEYESNPYNWGTPEYEDFYQKREAEREAACNKIAKEFFDKTESAHVVIVEYSDNDGETQATLEHGDVFAAVPHIRVSKH